MHLGEERVELGRISQGVESGLYLLAVFLSFFFFFCLLCFYGADPVCSCVTLRVKTFSVLSDRLTSHFNLKQKGL